MLKKYINQNKHNHLNSDVLEWLKSFVEDSESHTDTIYYPNFHSYHFPISHVSFRDFYSETNDVDLELTQNMIYVCHSNQSNQFDRSNQFDKFNKFNNFDKMTTRKKIKTSDFINLITCDENEKTICMDDLDDLDDLDFVDQINLNELVGSTDDKKILLKCIEKYQETNVFISPSTILFHTSMLFKIMLNMIKHNGMKVSIPEIIYNSGKYTIRHSEHFILNPENKNDFYLFCYKNTTTKSNNKILELKKHSVPPIITKETFGNVCLNSTLKMTRKIKMQEEMKENKTAFDLLSYDDSKKLFNELNTQIYNYKTWATEIWENVFQKYLSKENIDCHILNKLQKCVGGPIDYLGNKNPFFVFFNNLPLFKEIIKIKNRLRITLAKHEIEYNKIIEKQIEKNKLNRIDTSKLFGNTDDGNLW